MNQYIVQGVGFLGVLFFVCSYQMKDNRKLFAMQMLGCLSFGVQFIMLHAYSGFCILMINIVRNVMMTRYNDHEWIQWKGWSYILSAAIIVGGITIWDGPETVLAIIGNVAATLAAWTNNARKIRLANAFINSPCVMAYDAIIGSWGGVVNESITIISIVVSIVRFGWKALDGDAVGDADTE